MLDFGSQYAHLIAKRFRMLGYYSEILSPAAPISAYEKTKGIVLSGGPSSIYESDAPRYNPGIFSLGIPILGLCYGHYVVAQENGGRIGKGGAGEFGFATLTANTRLASTCPLFKNIDFPAQVWMSHQDEITECAPGFERIASTENCTFAAVQNLSKKQFGLQFHAEVNDTPCGNTLFQNFAEFCGMPKNWDQAKVLSLLLDQIKTETGAAPMRDGTTRPKRKVLLFLSGGVDSTVAFALLNKAIGQENVLGLHIDNGFMRKNESAKIAERYRAAGFSNFMCTDASAAFLDAIKDETDPQKKRRAVGETFITVRDKTVAELHLNDEEWLLGQGTLYPDVIESGGTEHSKTIKTHHNRVEGIQALIEKGLIIEPLKELYKDEVRAIGATLGLPDEMIYRHPFPGPGLSINVLCGDGEPGRTEDDEAKRSAAEEKLRGLHLHDNGFFTKCEASLQSENTAPLLSRVSVLPVKSVGVQGDFRTYTFPAVLEFRNISSAFPDWAELEKASSFITNSIADVNRTVLLLRRVGRAAENPEHMRLQKARCDKHRLDQTREIDAIVLEELRNAGLYRDIFQHLTINIPFAVSPERCSAVLRPVVSEDVMTARFAHIPVATLQIMMERISALEFVDALYYDITNKPPATFGWE